MTLHLEEFLYRGRPEGSDEPPAWHVRLADVGLDGFGRPTISLSPEMPPQQAEAMGFPLPTILEGINLELMAENEALRAEIEALKSELAAREAASAAATGEQAP